MNFDVIIIGGGLAGLTCGIALQQQGKDCAIINNGQTAMDFSTGSMDLLSRKANSEMLLQPEQGFQSLPSAHPYKLIGQEKVLKQAQKFSQLAQDLNLGLVGTTDFNHLRLTTLGGVQPAWLSPDAVPTLQFNQAFPYQRLAILGIEGYQDFQPQLFAENLAKQPAFSHCEISTGFLSLPELDNLRMSSREFRSVHIARALEQMDYTALVKHIQQASQGAEAVFLPACFDLQDVNFFNRLRRDLARLSLIIFSIPTFPPSMLGGRQHKLLRQHFEQLGGLMINGDSIVKAEINNNQVQAVFSKVQQQEPLNAQHFILATGNFFSKGLVASFDAIREPIFHCDIIGEQEFKANNRLTWTHKKFSSPQPYQSAGVAINAHCQAQKDGQSIENLYAIGNVIGGFNSLALGCSSGVAVVTALTAAEHILGGSK